METTATSKVNRTAVISETVKVNNLCDATRKYDITANATYYNGSLTSVDNGEVRAKDASADTAAKGTFNRYSEDNLYIAFHTPDNRSELMAEVEAFLANLNGNGNE